MSTLYALLVGIDRYREVPSLLGCGNDIDDVGAALATAAGAPVDARVLKDEQATLSAVVAGLSEHLSKAGPGDTALFWFSGHGSQARASGTASEIEPTGWLQTLVCHDSRGDGVPDLLDKEVSVLLDRVAERARHVAVVLDACHSEGGTRDAGGRVRGVAPGPRRDPVTVLPGPATRTAGPAAGRPEHVALAACRRDQKAQERTLDGRPRGLFTWSLLRAWQRLGRAATYRDLLDAARSEVAQRRAYEQVPQLYPDTSAVSDTVFLHGSAGASGPGLVLSYDRAGWQVNAGRAHGLPAEGDGLRFGVAHTRHEVRVREIRSDRSLVAPVNGWEPDPDRQFAVVLTALSRPSITVTGAVPAGFTSPHVRVATVDEEADLVVGLDVDGPRITDRESGVEVTAAPDRLAATLEHIARWRALLGLCNTRSRLGAPIAIEIAPAAPDPAGRTPALDPGVDGAYHLYYEPAGSAWAAPEVVIRLRNTGTRTLYVTLLDLTPRYGVHAALFPVAPIGPGRETAALEGRPIRVSFPEGTPVEPGRSIRDRLLLVIAEQPFDAGPYHLPSLTGEFRPAVRDLGEVPPPGSGDDWTVQRVTVVTGVRPATPPAPGAGPDPAR